MNVSKISASRILLIVIFGGFVFSLVLLLFRVSLKSSMESRLIPLTENKTVLDEQESISSPLSVRLKIPKINVDAEIDPLGLTPNGDMEAPRGGRNVGWFNGGPHPGDTGSAVIDGHFGPWKNGEGSVFDDLHTLVKGDTLQVEDATGATTTFIVRESRILDPNADASDVFSSDDEGSHLNLITCEGVWDKVSKSYSGRLVVFTDKE